MYMYGRNLDPKILSLNLFKLFKIVGHTAFIL